MTLRFLRLIYVPPVLSHYTRLLLFQSERQPSYFQCRLMQLLAVRALRPFESIVQLLRWTAKSNIAYGYVNGRI